MGCPLNAKQSMLVTTIPAALDRGATLVTRARAQALAQDGDRVTTLTCAAMDAQGIHPLRPPDHAPRENVHRRGRRHRHAGAAAAQPRSRPARGPRQTHVPAPGGDVRGADARRSRGLLRRAADRLFRPLHRNDARGRADRVQARGTAVASGAGRDHAAESRRGARGLDAAIAETAGRDRPAARRLSSGQPRRHGDDQRRRDAGARLSADTIPVGGRAPRVPGHGRDPVRGRRHPGDAHSRRRHRISQRDARRERPSTASRSPRSSPPSSART